MLKKSNKFIFVLKMFLLRIEKMKLKNDFLNLNKTFFLGVGIKLTEFGEISSSTIEKYI